MTPWTTVTAIGDSKVMLPAAACILIWLTSIRARDAALLWAALFGGALLTVVATKLAFIGWGIGIASFDFTGISGHAMRATAVLPVIAFLLFQRFTTPIRTAALALAGLAGILIAVSRVMVGAHSVSEAVAGAVLGCVVSLIFIRLIKPVPASAIRPELMLASIVVLCALAFTGPAPTKVWLKELALFLSGQPEPYAPYKHGGAHFVPSSLKHLSP